MHAQLELTYAGSTSEVNHLTKKYNIAKSITLCLKDQDVLLDYKLLLYSDPKTRLILEGKVKLKKAIC